VSNMVVDRRMADLVEMEGDCLMGEQRALLLDVLDLEL